MGSTLLADRSMRLFAEAVTLLAAGMGGYSIIQLILLAIVLAGAFGILFIVLRQTGVAIPPWVIQIGWIVAVVCVGIIAVKFISGL